MAARRIGVLGGSFNPPHVGHLAIASEAHAALGLDRVLLVPAGEPPHKRMEDDPGAETRFELCVAACAGDERLEVSRAELDREGPSFTVDTLRALHAAAPRDALTLIVGGDMAESLPTGWREPEAILDLATLAVAERGERRQEAVRRALAPLGRADRVVFLELPRLDLSSTEIRRRIREGRPIRYLVPDGVAAAVADRGLYRQAVRP